uniref:Pentacotripeptide-repeat region of PRORP domain-containing protein n=1 Tax=Setaria italica TaxID=4555 RepID=K3ZET7_SETIT
MAPRGSGEHGCANESTGAHVIYTRGLFTSSRVLHCLVKGLCQRGEVDAAVRLKDEMAGKAELVQNSAVYGVLVRALFRVGRKGEVDGLLEGMKGRGIVPHRDRVVYNAMIAGFCEDERDPSAAFAVLDDMQKCGCKPNAVTYNMRGCPPDVVTYRMLFDGLCAAGEFHEANRVLIQMVVKGFAPSKDGARKFVEAIEKEGDGGLLESVLCQLAKVNALERSGWEKAVSIVLNDPAELRIEKQLASIRFA